MATQVVAKKINLSQKNDEETGFINLFDLKEVTNLKNCIQNEKKELVILIYSWPRRMAWIIRFS